MTTLYIGIDAGIKTGFAVWDSGAKKFIFIDTMSFWGAIYKIDEFIDMAEEKGYKLCVVVEDVEGNSPVFNAQLVYKNTRGEHNKKLGATCKYAQDVGRVKAYSRLIIEFCKYQEIKCLPVVPGKGSYTKLDQEKFYNLTKTDKSVPGVIHLDEHGRDAAMLVWYRD